MANKPPPHIVDPETGIALYDGESIIKKLEGWVVVAYNHDDDVDIYILHECGTIGSPCLECGDPAPKELLTLVRLANM